MDQIAVDTINHILSRLSLLDTQISTLEMLVATVIDKSENKGKIRAEIRTTLSLMAEKELQSLPPGEESQFRMLARRLGVTDL